MSVNATLALIRALYKEQGAAWVEADKEVLRAEREYGEAESERARWAAEYRLGLAREKRAYHDGARMALYELEAKLEGRRW